MKNKKLLLLIGLIFYSVMGFSQVPISSLPTYTGNPSGGWVPIVFGTTTRKIDAGIFGNDTSKVASVYRNSLKLNISDTTGKWKPIGYVPAWSDITGIVPIWNQNTTGNASTVTNGIYTTGIYSNPSWLTSLVWSKITSTPTTLSGYGITDGLTTATAASTYSPLAGSSSITTVGTLSAGSIPYSLLSGVVPIWNQNTTGNAATVTNGLYSTGSYLNPSWLTGLAWSKISSTPTTLSGYGITDGVSLTGTQTLTNKTLSGASNTFSNIPYSALTGVVPTWNQNTTGTAGGLSANIAESQVTNLTTDLSNKQPLENQRLSTTNSPIFTQISTATAIRFGPTDSTTALFGPYNNTRSRNYYMPSTNNGDTLATQKNIPTNNNQLINGSNYITASGAPVQSVAGKTGTVTLSKGDVGLSNVDNTSDATKNSAVATLTNKTLSGSSNTFSNIPESAVTSLTTDLAAKATDASVMHLAGTETVTGNKIYSNKIQFISSPSNEVLLNVNDTANSISADVFKIGVNDNLLTAIGIDAGYYNQNHGGYPNEGFGNSYFGYNAGQYNTVGKATTAVGALALDNYTGRKWYNLSDTTVGADMTFMGYNAASNTSSGSSSVGLGNEAGYNVTNLKNVTLLGAAAYDMQALSSAIDSTSNLIAIGAGAIQQHEMDSSIAIGTAVGSQSTGGVDDIILGDYSGRKAAGNLSNTTILGHNTYTYLNNIAAIGSANQDVIIGADSTLTDWFGNLGRAFYYADNGDRLQVNGNETINGKLGITSIDSVTTPTTNMLSWNPITHRVERSLVPISASTSGNADSLGGIAAINYPTLSSTSTLTNKTLSGSSNTFSNIPYTALSGTVPTWNQNTTGTAASLTTGRTIGITGDVTWTSPTFNGSANVTAAATVTKINGTALSGLTTGILKNTTGTGVPSIAIAGTDYLTPTGSGASLTGITESQVTNLTTDLAAKLSTTTAASTYALLASPTFTGVPKISTDTVATLANIRSMSAGAYTLPTASSTVLGGVKIGSGISIASGVISATPAFSAITSTPTSLSGYGITDALSSTTAASTYVPLTRTVNGHALSANITVSASDVGLGSVDNTSDLSKPISTATQTALNAKVDTSYRDSTVLKYPLEYVGDTIKLSQTYLDSLTTTYASIASPTFTGTPKISTDTIATKAYARSVGGSGSGMPDLSTRNYSNDSTAVVVGGLSLWDYYRTGSSVKIVSTLPTTLSSFNFIATTNYVKIRWHDWNESISVTRNWGDGSPDTTDATVSDVTYIRNYSTYGTYRPTFVIDNYAHPTELYITDSHLTNIFNLTKLSGVSNLTLSNDSLPNSLVDTLQFPASTHGLYLSSNGTLTDFSITHSLPSLLQTLDLSYCGLTAFKPTVGLPATVTSITLQGDKLTSTEVDNTLIWLDGLTINAGAKTLNIQQATAAPPTSASSAAITSLTSKGWTITHD